jgi:hypothetical protein
MTDDLNEHGNHAGEFTQGVGGWAEYTVWMTPTDDKVIHDVKLPPRKVIPIVFLPGVMGSNLRMTRQRQDELERTDNKAWKADDIGPLETALGNGYGAWFRNASPAQRQLNFDPDATEVDIYRYSEDAGRFDPEGTLTKESDAQHRNVPDSLRPIPPLLTHGVKPPPEADVWEKQRMVESAAQKARWRGWSEILFAGPYGEILQRIERQLNNMFVNGRLAPNWTAQPPSPAGPHAPPPEPPDPMRILGKNPKAFGAIFQGEALTEDDLRKIAACWYPVHAMGYNWLQSNGESARKIAERITGLINGYKARGFECEKVMLVTHSMGGLVARALVHPQYGNLQGKILGVYHNVMPTLGAGTAYKRLRFGFQEKNGGPFAISDTITAQVLSPDGEHATAILANAPAPLEMLPAQAYGASWLRVVDANGSRTLASWPDMMASPPQTALEAIYTQPAQAWWRLINPDWVNPGKPKQYPSTAAAAAAAHNRLDRAYKFSNAIEKTFHPVTYASWCDSPARRSYGEVVFRVTEGLDPGDTTPLPPPATWTLLTDDGKKVLTVQAGARVLTLQRQPAAEAGDETVPAWRSAQEIIGNGFVHGKESNGYEHQASYADDQVAASTLYALVQIAKTDQWK